MEKLNKKNGEKVSVQSKNQRGIFYRLKDRLKLNKKNGKKVIVQPEDQLSLAYELTNKYKLEKNKSDDMKALVALGKDLSKYAPATIEGILFYLPLTPEKKNLFQPRNRIVQPEDQQSHAYRLTNKYELKMERTNPEKFAKLGRELSRYDPATIEGILLHLPLIPEEKDLLQPRNRIVQPEDQLELADRLIDKYKLKNKHTNLKTMAALGKDLSRYDPDSTEGILLHLPLIPEEKKQLQPRNRIVQPEDQLELAYRITKKYKLKHQHTNLKTFVALGKDLSRYDPDSTEGILLHLPLIPEEKNLLQPRNRIVKPEDRLELADRLTDKYNLKMERTDPVTFAKLDRELSKYDSDSTEGILLHLPLIPEEKNLLQPRNRIVKPENQPNLAYRLTKKYKLKNQHTNVKTLVALGKELSKYDPNSTEGILLLLPLIPEEKKLLQPRNRIAQPKDQPALAYELTEEKKQSTNMETLVALDKDLSKDDPTSSGGNISNLPLNPKEKNLLQPSNRIAQPEDQPALAYELTEEKKQSTNMETLVALDKDLSKDDPTSSEGNISNLPLNPEEKKLLQPSNRIAQPEDQPALAYELTEEKKQSTNMETLVTLDKDLSKDDPTSSGGNISNRPLNPEEKKLLQQRTIEMESIDRTFFIDYLNEQHNLNSNTPLSEKTKAALIEDLDKFYYLPLKPSTCYNFISDLHIINRDDVYELLNDQIPKVNELITQVINNATLAITNKYQLLENQSVPKEKLETITTEILDLNLGEEQEREVIAKLEISKEDRATLEEIYREKRDLLQTQESQKDAEIKAATIAITNTYELSVEKTTPQEKLKAIANELINRNLSTLQEHEIIYLLEIETKDRDTLRTIYKELKKIQESQKDANVKAVTIAFTNIYKLSEDQPNSQNNLKAIAKTIVDLDLSDEQKREVILELEIPKKDKDTLRSIYKELKIIQESQKDANIKAVTLAITNIYKLSEDQPNSQNNLKAIAKTIVDLDLSDEQKREVILELEIPKKDKDTLRKMYSNKLEKKLQKLHWERVSIATAISSKYLLSIEKTTPQEKLKAIANELMDLNPSEVQGIGKDIFHLLEMKTRDRKTLRTIYNELKKTQESQKYANIKAATLTITNIYELSKDQSNSPEKLNKTAKTIVDLDLSDEQKREVILELKIPEKDKTTLREMYSNELEKNLNGERVSIATAISSKYQLSVEKTTPQEKLNTIAKKITKLDLSDEQKREVIRILEIPEKDQDTLREMYLNKFEEKLNWKIFTAATAISSKYQLSVEKTTPQEKLKGIANELIDLNLSKAQEKEKEIIHLLAIETEDRDTLRTIYKELKKIQVIKKVATLAITTKYELSEDQSNSPEKLNKTAKKIAKLDLSDEQKREVIFELKIPEKDRDTLLSIYEEQKKVANIAIIKKYQPNAQYDLKEIAKHIANERRNNVKKKSTESEQLFQQNVNAVATTITNKHQLSEDRPATSNKLHRIANEVVNLNLNIDQKLELMRTLALTQADKDKLRNIFSNSVINDKIVSLLAEEIKVAYQLSENKTISPKDLHEIAITIENSSLDKKYMDTVSNALVMTREDKETLRDMIRERAKQQTEKKQENEVDIKINGKTIAEVLDDNALLLSRAMNTALELKENKKVEPEILSMMAEFIGSRKLNEINRRNMPYMLTLTKEDKKELNEITNEKTTLLNKELEISQEPAKMNLSSTLSQGLNNLDSKPKNPLQTSPKPNLRTLLNQSENTPGLEPNTSPKPGTLPKAPARINLLNVVVQNKIVSLLAETIKVNYQLSENKTISPKDLHEIAITIENSYLDEKYMDTLSDNLVMRIEEKEALRDIIRERAKQQTDKKQENEADIKINGKTIAEVVDDNALLLSRAMNTALALKENQKVEPKMLSTMAEFIGSRKLNEINRRNIPYMLTLTKEDKKELNEIINGKTTLLSKLPELDRTNPNPIDQVPLPLNQRLSNRGSEQNTLPKPNKNIKQMNSLSQGSAEVSR
ncbi:hypothetical protein FAD87_RS06575 [Enterococcus hirae]|uniref:hypothetical protein n=2 Tax=Enterococcus TaxID=1350 RepID=UPI0009C15FAD|nr:hypothetical protein [Enterococcus hirae]EMF0051210.1 hypothetical protein [Enterococcus hirae]EMF0093987.1 hypothetical protein [Enterococcus hirae]EMF0101955.1 hypothetical protein [Enterococcus hirae]EMF0124054.1 hypothetical protein [Enterococcus hirae]OQO46458.1 hypothetical protein BH737_00180 [Enterococcus hirae]